MEPTEANDLAGSLHGRFFYVILFFNSAVTVT
jgi:hypothetical protein